MHNPKMTRWAAISSFASTAWGDPMEMVADAFGDRKSPMICRKRHEINKRIKADKARKAAKKARRRNRR